MSGLQSHGGIVAAYVSVALVLLLFGLFARWRWTVKLGLVAATLAAWLAVYFAMPALLGWPTEDNVPKRFNLLGVYIQEPDPVTRKPGGVFFWATDLDAETESRPRAYRLPFSASYKSVFEEAQGKLRQKIPQVGEVEPDDEVHALPQERLQTSLKSVKIKLRDAPAVGPPSKDAAP